MVLVNLIISATPRTLSPRRVTDEVQTHLLDKSSTIRARPAHLFFETVLSEAPRACSPSLADVVLLLKAPSGPLADCTQSFAT